MYEERITNRLEKYWDFLRASKPVPHIDHFNREHIANLWDHCFIISAKDEALAYSHIGMKFVNYYGMSISRKGGAIYDDLLATYKHTIPDCAHQAIQQVSPVFHDSQQQEDFRNYSILYRIGLYPFIDDSGKVVKLLGGMRWSSSKIEKSF